MLDGYDIGINGCLTKEVEDNVKAFIGVVDDDVLLPDSSKTIALMLQYAFGKARRVGREFEFGPVLVDQLSQIANAKEACGF